VSLREFQSKIAATFLQRDEARGLMGTFAWFVEEVGELATALREDSAGSAGQAEEFADCLAWLASLANLTGVDLQEALAKYGDGCPRCHAVPCSCASKR
jgi:NTP pyrophosphatase (non-canonical NTP hydrolase)